MIEDKILGQYKKLKESKVRDAFKTRQVRDLLITELTDEFWIVTACDSDGGIGPKERDTIYSSGYELGRFGARVPLMETLASGAVPILVVDTLSVEMEPTGKEIIRGVRDEVIDAGMNGSSTVTSSTEDNVETVQTGMGVTVVSLVAKKDFKPGSSAEDDIVICVGFPKSAPEYKVAYDDPEIANLQCVS